jgi:hypothetical protein
MTRSTQVSVALLSLALLSGCGRWHVVTAQEARSGRVDLGRERIRVTYPPRTIVLRHPRGAGSYASGIDSRGDVLTLDLDLADEVWVAGETLRARFPRHVIRLDVERAHLPRVMGTGARGQRMSLDLTFAEKVERYSSDAAFAVIGLVVLGAATAVGVFIAIVAVIAGSFK